MENRNDMKMLFIVVNEDFAYEVLDIAFEAGLTGATILNARGETVKDQSIMGITVDTGKEIILSIADEAKAEKAMAAIKEKAGIKTPAHAFCFTMPIDRIVGLSLTSEEE